MDIVEVDGGGRRVERIGAGNNNKSQIRFLLIFVFSSCPRKMPASGVTNDIQKSYKKRPDLHPQLWMFCDGTLYSQRIQAEDILVK